MDNASKRQVGKMCFNAAKNFQNFGWYNDVKLFIGSVNEGTCTGNIIGIGKYNDRDDEPATIIIYTWTHTDYFVAFNRAIGPNVQNDLGDNMVNILRAGNNGNGNYQSYIDMLLDDISAYLEYNINNFAGTGKYLMIKINSINTSAFPAYSSVTIGFEGGPAMAPINPPTSAWPVSAYINPPTSAWTLSAPINPPTSAPVDNPTRSCNAGVSTDYWGYESYWKFLTGTSNIMSRGNTFYGKSRTYYEDIGCLSKSEDHTFNIND